MHTVRTSTEHNYKITHYKVVMSEWLVVKVLTLTYRHCIHMIWHSICSGAYSCLWTQDWRSVHNVVSVHRRVDRTFCKRQVQEKQLDVHVVHLADHVCCSKM